MFIGHKFYVENPHLMDGEVMAVTGSSLSLGRWEKDKVVIMEQDSENRNVWQLSVMLDEEVIQDYRYCVVVNRGRRVVVKQWETSLLPRRIRLGGDGESCQEIFGVVGEMKRIQRGWLSEESVVQLQLGRKGLSLWKQKHRDEVSLWVKVTPIEQSEGGSDMVGDESIDMLEGREGVKGVWPRVEVAALTENGCQMRCQEKYGIEYTQDEDTFICFELQLFNLDEVAFLVDIYSQPCKTTSEPMAPHHLGMCYIYPKNFKQTCGTLQSPLTSMKFQPLGTLTLDYLIIKPVADITMDFSHSYRNYWAEGWNGLDVGHRGLGNSYTKGHHCSNIKENTIGSMKDAILHGADMVEFDVQVSKDLVPVVFHEFNLCVQTKTKSGNDLMLDVLVKDLTLSELQCLKCHHPSEKDDGVKSFSQDGHEDHEPFPTLERVLNNLDLSCGFNIEIKYPQTLFNGNEESRHQMEMNLFLDSVLKCVFKNGGDRRIIFSSFSPDICSMMIHKQNRYPVLFLTQGQTKKYDPYMDPRTWTIRNGVFFAEMIGLLGLSAMAEALMADTSQMELVKSKNQVIFCWTDEVNDKEIVKYLKNLGVNGVIYDRMDQNNDKLVKQSTFVSEERRDGLTRSKYATSTSSSGFSDCYDPPSPQRDLSSSNFMTVL